MFCLQGNLGYLFSGFAASFLFLGIFELNLRIRNEQVSWFHRMMVLIMGLYLTVVFILTVSPDYALSVPKFDENINLVPFKILHTASSNPLNFWGNIFMFIPFGVLLVLLSKKCQNLFVTLLIGAELSLFIELLQLFNIRSTDIDDIILNTVGTLFGFIIGKLIIFLVPSLRRTIGIMRKADGKICRKHNDTGNIAFLAILIFASVFAAGFSKINDEIELPLINKSDPPFAEQPSDAPASKTISADINARNAFLWDVNANTVLYEKGSGQQIAPASTAKMLTALTVLDYCDEEDKVLVGDEIRLIASNASRAWLNTGDRLTVRQLLDALLLPSGNDAAYTLAVYTGRKISGDEELTIDEALAAFVAAMNEKALKLGAKDSNFTSPDGYDADGQYTTARDLACIARGFLKSDVLREISGSTSISDSWLSGKEVTYNNTNELINPESQYYYENATGLKTGKSEMAGCCLVSSAYIDNELYLCVVMGSTEEGRWTDSLTLYRAVE